MEWQLSALGGAEHTALPQHLSRSDCVACSRQAADLPGQRNLAGWSAGLAAGRQQSFASTHCRQRRR